LIENLIFNNHGRIFVQPCHAHPHQNIIKLKSENEFKVSIN